MGHEEALANVNEKELVEPLLDRILGEDIEVKLLAGGQRLRVRQGIRRPQVQKGGPHYRLEAVEGLGEPDRRADGDGQD